jgi:hypothetical protein
VTTLPSGETLPDYDDQHPEGVDIDALWGWLIKERPNGWRNTIGRDGSVIRDVLAALQAVGDATLVKNQTYRAMRKEGADIERLTARLANRGHAELIIEHGTPVDAAIAVIADFEHCLKVLEKLGNRPA